MKVQQSWLICFRKCSLECLDKKLVKGRIVFCEQMNNDIEPLLAGAEGQIVQDGQDHDHAFIFPLPSTSLNFTIGEMIKSYISSTK